MIAYILRRLTLAALTIFGVTILTFLLFRAMPGDIAAAHIGQKATQQQRADWMHRNGYDRPLVLNVDRRLMIIDRTKGTKPFSARDVGKGTAADDLALFAAQADDGADKAQQLLGRYVPFLSNDTSLRKLVGGRDSKSRKRLIDFRLADGSRLTVDIAGVKTCGQLIGRINNHPENGGRLKAGLTEWTPRHLFQSQFVDHFVKSVTFQARSLRTNEKITKIIAERAPRSLALTVPALALSWISGMVVSCLVAYYRGTVLDRLGVLLSVLGMCVPFLAFMIYGQWLMFKLAPAHAYGLFYISNIYVPVFILVVAGLGGSVRFYRTVILDEVNRDYVRTARAKGAALGSVLFKHVLKNCMLPILTNLVMAIPFLIMGSLLVETYFGIPGLGDLMLSSISNRDEPTLNAMVFLLALTYTLGVILTDISYAVFDPRIRLR